MISFFSMRYVVKAKVKSGKEAALLHAIDEGTLGRGSIAGDEYLHNMVEARLNESGVATWVECCFCDPPLQEERPYWDQYFELLSVKDAHSRRDCPIGGQLGFGKSALQDEGVGQKINRIRITRVQLYRSGEIVNEVRKFETPVPIYSVGVSADGRKAVSGGADGAVRLWDSKTGKELRRFDGHGDL